MSDNETTMGELKQLVKNFFGFAETPDTDVYITKGNMRNVKDWDSISQGSTISFLLSPAPKEDLNPTAHDIIIH